MIYYIPPDKIQQGHILSKVLQTKIYHLNIITKNIRKKKLAFIFFFLNNKDKKGKESLRNGFGLKKNEETHQLKATYGPGWDARLGGKK